MKNMLDDIFAKAKSADTTDFPISDEELCRRLGHGPQPSSLLINKRKIAMTSIATSTIGALIGAFILIFTNTTEETSAPKSDYNFATELTISEAKATETQSIDGFASKISATMQEDTNRIYNFSILGAVADTAILHIVRIDKENARYFGIELGDGRISVPFETIFGYDKFDDDLTEFVDLGYPRYTIANLEAVFYSDVKTKNQIKPQPYTHGRELKFTKMRPLFSLEKYFFDSDSISREPNRLSRNLYNEWPESGAIFGELKDCSDKILTAINGETNGNMEALGAGVLQAHIGAKAYPFAAQLIPVLHTSEGEGYTRLQIIWYLNDAFAENALRSNLLGEIYKFHTLDTCEALNSITMKNRDADYAKRSSRNKDIFKLGELHLSDAELKEIGLEKTKYGLTYLSRSQKYIKSEMDTETLEDLQAKGYDTTADTIKYRTLNIMRQERGLLGDTVRSEHGYVSVSNYGFRCNELEPDSIVEFDRAYPTGRIIPSPFTKYYYMAGSEYDPFDSCYFIRYSTIHEVYFHAFLADSNNFSLDPLKCVKNAISIRVVLGDTLQSDSSAVNSTELVLWYEATEGFAKLLPERYRDRILRELEVQKMVEVGAVQPDSVCTMLNYDQNILGMCGNHSGALSSLSAMPNPVRDVLRMKFALKEPRRLSIMLLGAKGEMVREIANNREYSAGDVLEEENISSMETGLYFLVIASDQGEQIYVKLIKAE